MKSTTLSNRKVSSELSKQSEDVLLNHLQSFVSNDLDNLMGDYVEDSILITHEQTFTGPGEIRAFFTELMDHFPASQSEFKLDKLVTDGELAFIVWHATTPSLDVALGTDTFVIKQGKIVKQTFAGKMKFLN
jgi:ketosteroid isomerase-like protein